MEAQALIRGNLPHRLRSCFFLSELKSGELRSTTASAVFTILMLDVCTFWFLSKAIRQELLPWFVADVAIVSLAFLEAAITPLWACLWARHRRRVILWCTLVPGVVGFVLLLVPAPEEVGGSEFCSATAGVRGDQPMVLPLCLLVMVAVVNTLCRSGIWCHSILLFDEFKPKYSTLNYGIIVMTRVIGYILLPKLLGSEFEVGILAVLGITIPLIINALQFWRMPEYTPPLEKVQSDSGILPSFTRIFSSKMVMGQIISISLLCGAIWGFGWHQDEMIKVKYLILEPGNFLASQIYLLPTLGIAVTVALYGLAYSLPPAFNKVSGAKLAAVSSILLVGSYCVVAATLTCDRGQVAGLGSDYAQPNCSRHCNCEAPWSEFKPICVLDTLTTYMSPCHAGCEGIDTVADVTSLRGCVCAPSDGYQRASFGACNNNSCTVYYQIFRMLYYLIITLTVLALQGKGMILLRTVEPRDRPLAVAVATTIALLTTFCGVHFSYLYVQVQTCAWREGGRCLLQADAFPVYVGGISAVLAGCSAFIGVTTWCAQRRAARQHKSEDALTSSPDNRHTGHREV